MGDKPRATDLFKDFCPHCLRLTSSMWETRKHIQKNHPDLLVAQRKYEVPADSSRGPEEVESARG